MLSDVKLILFDLDGTVYLDDTLIEGARDTLRYLRDKGVRVGYLTNNSSKTSDEYLGKLVRLNIYEDCDLFYSSLEASIDYLKRNYPDKKVYPVATKAVTQYITERGIAVDEDADIVLFTFDRELTYDKLVKANALIKKGAIYIATHPDVTCPSHDTFVPDLGSFIKLIEASAGRLPDVIIGKPYSYMADSISTMTGLAKDKIAMVGDRLHTDIAFGTNSGLNTVLVLTGESTLDDVEHSTTKPDVILKDINGLRDYF